jgi:hypothetical protein
LQSASFGWGIGQFVRLKRLFAENQFSIIRSNFPFTACSQFRSKQMRMMMLDPRRIAMGAMICRQNCGWLWTKF